jgi:hypothetical protein
MVTWNVYNLIRTVPEGVVERVACRITMIDGIYNADTEITQRVPYSSPDSPGFIPFDQLTEAETIGWVQNCLGPARITDIERSLQESIDKQKAPLAQGVPW